MGLLNELIPAPEPTGMRLKSILNRVEPHAGFVYEHAWFASSTDQPTIEIAIRPRRRSRAICSGCGQKRAGYDRLAPRRFEFVPLWGLAVVLVYAMRRIDCPQCGWSVIKSGALRAAARPPLSGGGGK